MCQINDPKPGRDGEHQKEALHFFQRTNDEFQFAVFLILDLYDLCWFYLQNLSLTYVPLSFFSLLLAHNLF